MTRSASRVLVLSRRDGATAAVAQGLEGPATVDVCEQVRTAVEWVASACGALGGYDAVLCQAERTDELSFIVRLRKEDPHTPIILVSGQAGHPDFCELARRMGATTVLPSSAPAPSVGKAVLQAAEACRIARLMRANAATFSRIAREVRGLVERQQSLAAESVRLARPIAE